MRYVLKRVRVLELTQEEITTLVNLAQDADKGQFVNSAQAPLSDGSFLQVSKVETHFHDKPQKTRDRELAAERDRERFRA